MNSLSYLSLVDYVELKISDESINHFINGLKLPLGIQLKVKISNEIINLDLHIPYLGYNKIELSLKSVEFYSTIQCVEFNVIKENNLLKILKLIKVHWLSYNRKIIRIDLCSIISRDGNDNYLKEFMKDHIVKLKTISYYIEVVITRKYNE